LVPETLRGSAVLPFKSERVGSTTAELSFSSQAHMFALTVEEYAALCAERELVAPEHVEETEKAYDINDPEMREAVDELFRLRFDRDPTLHGRWQQAYARYSTLLRDQQQS